MFCSSEDTAKQKTGIPVCLMPVSRYSSKYLYRHKSQYNLKNKNVLHVPYSIVHLTALVLLCYKVTNVCPHFMDNKREPNNVFFFEYVQFNLTLCKKRLLAMIHIYMCI